MAALGFGDCRIKDLLFRLRESLGNFDRVPARYSSVRLEEHGFLIHSMFVLFMNFCCKVPGHNITNRQQLVQAHVGRAH